MKELDFSRKDNQLAIGAIVGGGVTLTSGLSVGAKLAAVGKLAALPQAIQVGCAIVTSIANPVVGVAAIILGLAYLTDN